MVPDQSIDFLYDSSQCLSLLLQILLQELKLFHHPFKFDVFALGYVSLLPLVILFVAILGVVAVEELELVLEFFLDSLLDFFRILIAIPRYLLLQLLVVD